MNIDIYTKPPALQRIIEVTVCRHRQPKFISTNSNSEANLIPGSCLSTPSNTNYTDTNVNRDRQYNNRTFYVSYNTTANTQVNDYLPEGNMSLHSLNGSVVSLFGLYLFDSGSTSTLINERAVPPQVHPKFGESQIVTTTQGTVPIHQKSIMTQKTFFSPNFAKREKYLKYTYVPIRVLRHDMILLWVEIS